MAAESILDGTWSSGPPPAEFADWVLMKDMEWSWPDLVATPPYVKRFCGDFSSILNRVIAEARERQSGG